MKKFFSLLSVMAIALATTTAFTSCGSDDEAILTPILPTPAPQYAALVGHTLSGKNKIIDGTDEYVSHFIFTFTSETECVEVEKFYKNGVLKEVSSYVDTYRYDGVSVVEITSGDDVFKFYLEDGVWKSPTMYDVTFE